MLRYQISINNSNPSLTVIVSYLQCPRVGEFVVKALKMLGHS